MMDTQSIDRKPEIPIDFQSLVELRGCLRVSACPQQTNPQIGMPNNVEWVFFERALTLVCGILRPADSLEIPKSVSSSNKRLDRIPSHCLTKIPVGLLPVVIVESCYHSHGLRFRKRGVDVQCRLRLCPRQRPYVLCRLQSNRREQKEVAAKRSAGQRKFRV